MTPAQFKLPWPTSGVLSRRSRPVIPTLQSGSKYRRSESSLGEGPNGEQTSGASVRALNAPSEVSSRRRKHRPPIGGLNPGSAIRTDSNASAGRLVKNLAGVGDIDLLEQRLDTFIVLL